MISYFDTSAVIPLILDEPATNRCVELWDSSIRVISAGLVYPEARAALAQAQRMQRITAPQLAAAVSELESVLSQVDYIEFTSHVARSAGYLAESVQLRGYDAVHLASAVLATDDELVFVTGDQNLGVAAKATGLAVALSTGGKPWIGQTRRRWTL